VRVSIASACHTTLDAEVIHTLRSSVRVRVCGSDELVLPLQDCAGKTGSYINEYLASRFLRYGFVRDYVGACGLPASTVKVTLNLTTCVGAVTQDSIVSIDRCRVSVFVRTRICVRTCVREREREKEKTMMMCEMRMYTYECMSVI
jgi:hypothetical protein